MMYSTHDCQETDFKTFWHGKDITHMARKELEDSMHEAARLYHDVLRKNIEAYRKEQEAV